MLADASTYRSSGKSDERVDVMRLIRVFRSYLPIVAPLFLIIVAIAVAVAVHAPKKYTAVATVKINPPVQAIFTNPTAADSENDPAAALIDTEVGELQSTGLAQSVVQQLRLDKNPEFNPALKSANNKADGAATQPPPANSSIDPVVYALLGHIKVTHVGATYLLTVQAKSRDPVMAAQIANTFVQQFIVTQQSSRTNAVEAGGSKIDDRLHELRRQVETANAALQQYKIAHGLMSAQGATLTEQEITGLDQALAQARAQQAEADARLSTAKAQMANGSSGADVGEALDSPVVQQLRQRRAEISQTLADLQGRYGDAHPKLLKAQRELADTDAQIQAEINRIISNLAAQSRVARDRVASMEGSINGARGSLEQNGQAQVGLVELQNNADAATSLYDTFLNKYKEANAAADFQQSDATIVDMARVPPWPSEPKRGLIVLLGVMAGLCVAIGYVLVAEQLFAGLNDVDAVESMTGRPYLGSIPLLQSTFAPGERRSQPSIDPGAGKPAAGAVSRLLSPLAALLPLALRPKALRTGDRRPYAPIDYVVSQPLSSFTESIRSLLAALRFSNNEQPPQVIMVTSSLPDEGKTTTSICMGRVAAMSGERTVLVDCDIRKRSVNRALQLDPKVGLVEVLNDGAALEDALMLDEKSGMLVLPLAKSESPVPQNVLAKPAMLDLLATLRQRFDLIILDTGPVVLITSTRQLSAHADAVLLLALWRKTTRRLVRTSLRLLDAASAPVAGIALGRVDLQKTATVDPADPSSYYRTYKDYYMVEDHSAT